MPETPQPIDERPDRVDEIRQRWLNTPAIQAQVAAAFEEKRRGGKHTSWRDVRAKLDRGEQD